MIDISDIFSTNSSTNNQWISLCGHLEVIIGNYFLSPIGHWYAIYYDPTIDRYNECAEIIDKNLIGYVYCDDRVAFILNSCLERFINDTVDYDIHYVGVDSLDGDCLECKRYSDYCEHILPALWIDDDFLSDEKLEFDYGKVELIDDGVKYLNPKHFSVKNLVMYCRLCIKEI